MQARALQILAEHPSGIRPKEFARLMWPDSSGWRRVTKCGNGVHRGGGMHLAAGGLLGRLRARGLAMHGLEPGTTCLTPKGYALFAALSTANP